MLDIVTTHSSGLLPPVARALIREYVQIVATKVRVDEDSVLLRLQVREDSGEPIGNHRRRMIQDRVMAAVGDVQVNVEAGSGARRSDRVGNRRGLSTALQR